MLATEVNTLLESKNTGWMFSVQGEGRNFQIEAVSEDFESMTRVKRQQAVLRLIADEIAAGTLHAITVMALTPDEKSAREELGI
ncbi:MAG TPA: cell division protein BolA [Gammaproteobacteria bacterium]|nr:cell division protein BolA [Gammaproteobacteria bacterium]|tara:strand:+ start:653 stop:904 length:252 start_codon:yes stop_codon:yes gene_type:complete